MNIKWSNISENSINKLIENLDKSRCTLEHKMHGIYKYFRHIELIFEAVFLCLSIIATCTMYFIYHMSDVVCFVNVICVLVIMVNECALQDMDAHINLFRKHKKYQREIIEYDIYANTIKTINNIIDTTELISKTCEIERHMRFNTEKDLNIYEDKNKREETYFKLKFSVMGGDETYDHMRVHHDAYKETIILSLELYNIIVNKDVVDFSKLDELLLEKVDDFEETVNNNEYLYNTFGRIEKRTKNILLLEDKESNIV